MERLTLTLAEEHAATLESLEGQLGIDRATIARRLLERALEEPRDVDRLREPLTRRQLRFDQALAGETITLDEL